jgi:hypothetical protein
VFAVKMNIIDANGTRDAFKEDSKGEYTLAEFLEFTKSTLLLVSDQALKEEISRGFGKDYVTVTDRVVGKPVSLVHPLGQISFVSSVDISEVVMTTYAKLIQLSKVDTGLYQKSHYVFLNGTQVANDISSLAQWLATNPQIKERDLIRIVNIQPYARKLERLGVTSKRQQRRTQKSRDKRNPGGRVSAPNGTYYLVSRTSKAKFKNNVAIRFSFISGAQLGIKGSFKSGRKGRNSAGRPYLYPTIMIGIRAGGIK